MSGDAEFVGPVATVSEVRWVACPACRAPEVLATSEITMLGPAGTLTVGGWAVCTRCAWTPGPPDVSAGAVPRKGRRG